MARADTKCKLLRILATERVLQSPWPLTWLPRVVIRVAAILDRAQRGRSADLSVHRQVTHWRWLLGVIYDLFENSAKSLQVHRIPPAFLHTALHSITDVPNHEPWSF
ncbi:hypothetical protein SCLCIDRAFT_674164 [Scleroderma citrinum Foug A]|uniref:Uncharacterized protein n=1 Tax=Scleroderma citrinum Foug A TaxID=1036808 RepID=A0A0C3E658_9AGAM|nr:hypothetical protein SCLCIDRAFT_674164 [Scleroderma citrinum Foug A]